MCMDAISGGPWEVGRSREDSIIHNIHNICIYIYICIYTLCIYNMCIYIYIYTYIYIYIYYIHYAAAGVMWDLDSGCRGPGAFRQRKNSVDCSGVHKGGFSKGEFSKLCVIIMLVLLNPPLLSAPL